MKKAVQHPEASKLTAITNAHIFDGERTIDAQIVVLDGAHIQDVGGVVPAGAAVVDAHWATLMPGLIDAHVHTDIDGLRDALLFGVTTELEMMGHWSARERRKIAERPDVADIRSAGMGVTPPGGHPSQYMKSSSNLLLRFFFRYPFVASPEEAVSFVRNQVANGSDFIKIFLEDGTTIGFPGLPVTNNETLLAAVDEAHHLGRMAIAHVTTVEGGQKAVSAGVDGLAHLFFDRAPSPELVTAIASSGAFVTPTLVTLSTAFGNSAAALAADKRVSSRLGRKWLDSLRRSMNVYPQGTLSDAYASVITLKRAGVDILAGSDVSEPIPSLGGLAHGASLHHELQLLVEAGLTPVEALRAATSTPARRFGLNDRGRIVNGARADLLLIDGDPLSRISDTLNIHAVWRRGVRLTRR
jgi:imidazolonepropionase-like amidohydrolase